MKTKHELLKSLDAFIEYAEKTKKFSDLQFYQDVKAYIGRTDPRASTAIAWANEYGEEAEE